MLGKCRQIHRRHMTRGIISMLTARQPCDETCSKDYWTLFRLSDLPLFIGGIILTDGNRTIAHNCCFYRLQVIMHEVGTRGMGQQARYQNLSNHPTFLHLGIPCVSWVAWVGQPKPWQVQTTLSCIPRLQVSPYISVFARF